jgi:sulfite reductase (NADPH) hemoprotein beta-component
MSDMDHPSTLGSTRLGFADERDVDLFVQMLEKFEGNELTPDEWRAFRLVNGVYGQRQPDVTMIRVKIPSGILTAPQLNALADVAERWANGKGHITTRQNIQYHFVKMSEADEVLYHLANVGLTTREACGNAVRNVTQCPFAGVSHTEVFDSNPYAEAVTRFLLRGKWSASLPRKFKIAFGGCCETDCIGAAFHDIGFFPRIRDGQRGFRVVIGGGLSTLRRNAFEAYAFLPAEQINEVSEAVVRVFHRTGDRKHRHKARLKFVIDKLGKDGFLKELNEELDKVRAEGGRPLVLPPPPPELKVKLNPVRAPRPGAAAFFEKNVRTQRQEGFNAVTVKVTLGDLTTSQFRALAGLAQKYSAEEELRLTIEQNLVFRYVKTADLPGLHADLVDIGLADVGPLGVLDVLSCPGAMSCKLAVTQSRGLASYVQEHLEARPEVTAKAEKLVIKASGCPNSCGQHHVAGIGFQGGVKKVGGKALPLYHVYIGGYLGPEAATFGRIGAKIPARRAGVFVERLINLYEQHKLPGEDPNVFLARVDISLVKAAVADLTEIDESTATPEDFVDLGETRAFEVDLQEGECAA